MKIAQIVASLESRHGGPSRSVRGLSGGLAQAGHHVDLLSTVSGGEGLAINDGNLTTRIFHRARPEVFCPSSLLSDYLRGTSYDIVHQHGLWLRTLHYAHSTASRLSAPLVISPRGMMSEWAWNHRRWKKLLASLIVHPGAFSAAAGWHVTSDDEATDIRRLGFTQPICLAPNGVNLPSADESMQASVYWTHALPAISSKRVALFHSRFHSKKRVLELIDLWLSKPRGDWVLLLVGIPEGYSIAQLEAHAARQNGEGKVIVKDGTEAPPPYAVASLFLLPSHSENFGLVVAEALANCVPALVTDGTPWKEIETHAAGYCVSWADYGETLDRLLVETPETLRQRGERGRSWVEHAFSWAGTARTLAAFYEELRSSKK